MFLWKVLCHKLSIYNTQLYNNAYKSVLAREDLPLLVQILCDHAHLQTSLSVKICDSARRHLGALLFVQRNICRARKTIEICNSLFARIAFAF